MNILIKLTCLVGLVIAPILGGHAGATAITSEEAASIEVVTPAQTSINKETSIEKTKAVDGTVTAVVKTSSASNDEKPVTTEVTFKGTEAEVQAKLDSIRK
jgi:K(+)-stimulated pyrophosphate-energized sodium pump